MSILSICDQLRRDPFALLSERSAFSLASFFSGLRGPYAAINVPMARIASEFPGPSGLSLAGRAYLSSPSSEHGFERVLDALERDLREHGEPPREAMPSDLLQLADIVRILESKRTGLILLERTTGCLFDTLNGHFAGIAEHDPAEAARQRAPLDALVAEVKQRYAGTAPWHAVLRVFEGPDVYALEAFCRLYRELQARDGALYSTTSGPSDGSSGAGAP